MAEGSDDFLDDWLSIEPEAQKDKVKKSHLPEGEKIRLTSAQEKLWIINQSNPGNPVYNYAEKYTFKNPFNQQLFLRALDKVVQAHDVFHHNYRSIDGTPQIILNNERDAYLLIYKDDFVSENDFEVWCRDSSRLPFDLEYGPLLRILIANQNDQVTVVINAHHLIVDAWSMQILRNELATLYSDNISTELNDSMDFREYAYQSQGHNEKPLTLEKRNSELKLPGDFREPPTKSYQGAILWFELSEELNNGIRKTREDSKATFFNIFLSIFMVFLHKSTKSKEITVGIPVTNRLSEDLQKTVGYMVDSQVISQSIDPSTEFNSFQRQIGEESRKTMDQVHTTNGSFNFMFVHHQQAENPFRESGIEVDVEFLDLGTSKFDLTMHLIDEGEKFTYGIEYSTELFHKETIRKFSRHIRSLIQQVSIDSSQSISNLSCLSGNEKDLLVYGRNEHFKSNGTETILTSIESHLGDNDKIAVVAGGDQITYQQLNTLSASISKEIEKLSIPKSSAIGIYSDRSVQYVAAILGVLRSGRHYVPLDTSYPLERIKYYAEEAQVAAIICKEDKNEEMKNLNVPIVYLSPDPDIEGFESPAANPDDLAYIIFTSGSTGKPKGVPISHYNLYSSTMARLDFYEDPVEAFLLVSPFAFDSSVAGIFWTLASGGKLVIATEDEVRSTSSLVNLIKQEGVSHTLMLPSLYQMLLEEPNFEDCLSGVIVAGESSNPDLVNLHRSKAPRTQLFNEYGPTENTVWSTVAVLEEGLTNQRVPIGHPISNTYALVLDEEKQVVPDGMIGELYLGGDSITLGYLKNRESHVFVRDEFFRKGEQLYKTGDLVRYRYDGQLEFIGRNDSEVKIRGHRIDLSEIRMAISEYPGVTDVHVSVFGKNAGTNRKVVAWYTTQNPKEESSLKEWLRTKLPDYLIPSSVIAMEQFSRLPNGKIDVNQLPEPEVKQSIISPASLLEQQIAAIWKEVLEIDELGVEDDFFELGGDSLRSILVINRCKEIGLRITPAQFFRHRTVRSLIKSMNQNPYEPPANTIELEWVKVWENQLNMRLIGVTDTLDSLGLNDFAISRLQVELSHHFKTPISLTVNSSIRSCIQSFGGPGIGEVLERTIPIRTSGEDQPLFCIHSEFYFETVFSDLTRHLPSSLPVYSIQTVSPELVNLTKPKNMEDVSGKCVEEIRKVKPFGPYNILGFSISNVVAFDVAKRLQNEGEKVSLFLVGPPLFFGKVGEFYEKNPKVKKALKLLVNPQDIPKKVVRRLQRKREAQNVPDVRTAFEQTGLLAKFIKDYKVEEIKVPTVIIKTPIDIDHKIVGWDSLVELKDTEEINAPHELIIREPWVKEVASIVQRNL